MKTGAIPHVLKLNDRVYQRLNPWQTGTVTSIRKDVSFTVTYDQPDRRIGQQRIRYTYQWEMMRDFLVGSPPQVSSDQSSPIPVEVDAFQ